MTRRNATSSVLKRTFDLTAAAAGLLLLSPVMILAWACIRAGMGRPVLFRHRRVGAGETEFTLIKFRTMSDRRDPSGRPLPDQQRLGRLGSWLRRASIDELPQLWNVLGGDMSLVGPRPLLPEYLPRYSPHQRRRHQVKPGITGWAQVNGRNALAWEERFDRDVWYVDHWSLWLDLRILAITVWKVLRRDGISRDGYATMPEFLGSPAAGQGAGPSAP